MRIKPVLVASAQGSAGQVSSYSFNLTIPNLGQSGLIVVAGHGREQDGQHDPEEVDHITFNGAAMTKISDANKDQDGLSLYEIHGSAIPVAGTYAITIYHKGTGNAKYHHGVAAAFRNVFNKTYEHVSYNTYNNLPFTAYIDTDTRNALLVGAVAERTGHGMTCLSGQILIQNNTVSEQGGLSLWYQTYVLPGTQTFQFQNNNSETDMYICATLAAIEAGGGALSGMM
jgi:hypothetical protein